MPPTKSYEMPPLSAPESTRLGWCLEAEAEGRGWLQSQRPAQGWERDLSMLSAPMGDTGDTAPGLSNVGYNKGKRIAREIVASLANFRHEGEYKPAWDNKLYTRATTLTQLDANWYRECHINDVHRAGLQWAVGTGTGYFYQTWDKHFHSPYRGDIRLQALGPQDVTFVQLPKDHDIQRAYAVIIREELPINLAKAIYAEQNQAFADALTPDREQPGWIQKGLQRLQRFVSPALRVAGRMDKNDAASFPTVDIFHMYVMDRTINTSGFPRKMGEPGTNWAYTVPSLGDPISTGIVNPQTSRFFTQPAGHAEARVFPLRRYVIYSNTGLCYDGSSPWWHGAVPLTRLSFNDWAWEALGSSLVGELKTMQDGIVALMRMIEDSAAARLDPGMLYDESIAQTWADAVNPRKAGVRAKAPLLQLGGENVLRPILQPEYYNVPPWITQWIVEQEGRMDYMSGVTDLVAIAKAKQVPGADTLEKLMEMAGPIVQDLVRRVEKPLQQLGDWRLALYHQFYTTPRMLTITGPDGVPLDVDYKPENLIPLGDPAETPESRALRTRGYLSDFRYVVTESGINEIHRMSTKLFYIQLMKSGFPIDWWTFAKVAGIANFGPPPENTNTVMERWVAQQHIQADLQVDLAAEQQQQAAAAGIVPAGGPDGAGGDGNQPPPDGGTGHAGAGRPPSFNKPAHIENKDGGTRSTIATS